jgi:hypothetical protein
MSDPASAPTPVATKLILVATLAVTAAAIGAFVATRSHPVESRPAAAYLGLFTALFLFRVVGQVIVRLGRPRWLPPTEQWNLTPYHLLLPTQIAILALLAWIDVDFARAHGFWTEPRPALGRAVLWFALAYASAMALRYAVQMGRRPDRRWFGGAIPIVFHGVLAGYLFVFGSYHASR